MARAFAYILLLACLASLGHAQQHWAAAAAANPANPAARGGGAANTAALQNAAAAAVQSAAGTGAAAGGAAAGAAGSTTLQIPYSTMKVVYPLGKDFNFGGRRPYYRFTHARLYKKTLTLWVDPAVKQPLSLEEAKKGFFVSLTALSTADTGLNVRVKRWDKTASDPFQTCTDWVRGPAYVYRNPWRDITWHYFLEVISAVVPTLDAEGLLANFDLGHWRAASGGKLGEKLDLCDFQQRLNASQVTMLTWPNRGHWKWDFSMEMMAKEQILINDNAAYCFEDLTVGRSQALSWYIPYPDAEARFEARARAVWFLKQAAALEHLRQAQGIPSTSIMDVDCKEPLPASYATAKLPIVTYISRGKGPRAVRNEPKIHAYINTSYEVQLETPDIRTMSAYATIDLIQSTKTIFGMHGTGLTSFIFLSENSSSIQLVPYAWDFRPNRILRGGYFKFIAEACRSFYFQWVNPFPQDAFFRKIDFKTSKIPYIRHPTPDMPRPTNKRETQHDFWLEQQTRVNMTAFAPLLDEAFAAAGIALRPGVDPAPPWADPNAPKTPAPKPTAAKPKGGSRAAELLEGDLGGSRAGAGAEAAVQAVSGGQELVPDVAAKGFKKGTKLGQAAADPLEARVHAIQADMASTDEQLRALEARLEKDGDNKFLNKQYDRLVAEKKELLKERQLVVRQMGGLDSGGRGSIQDLTALPRTGSGASSGSAALVRGPPRRMSVSALAINLLTVVGLLFMLSLLWRRVLNITITLVVAGMLVIATIVMSGTVEIKYASQ